MEGGQVSFSMKEKTDHHGNIGVQHTVRDSAANGQAPHRCVISSVLSPWSLSLSHRLSNGQPESQAGS